MVDRLSHIRQWWVSLINGIVFLLLGAWILIAGISTYSAIFILLSIGFVVIGGFRAFYAYYNRKRLKYWSLLFVNGLIEFCVFIIILVSDYILTDLLVVYIGFILLFRSILGMGISINFYYSKMAGWLVTLLFSVLGVIASFMMIWNPIASGFTTLVYPALTFLFVGISQFGITHGLKTMSKSINTSA